MSDTVVVLVAVIEDAGAPVGAVGTLVNTVVSLGGNVSDPDVGAVAGIAITAADTANGSWFYSVDDGANWFAFPAVADDNALLLAADAASRVYFQPAADFNGIVDPALTFRAWDTTSGSNGDTADTTLNGGSSAFSTATDTASLTVIAVNDAPSFTAADPPSVFEDAGLQTVNGWVTAFDPGPADESGQSVMGYAVSSVSNPGLFAVLPAVDVNGNLTYTPAVDANGTSTFDVVVQDNGGTANGGVDTSAPQTFTISVIAVNDAPTLSDTTVVLDTIFQNAPAPSGAVGTLVNAIVSLGGNVSDVDSGAVAGIAITAGDTANGSWFYSLDDGANWLAFPAVADDSALLLAADADNRVYFQPATNFIGTIASALIFRAWDTTSGSDGDTADSTVNGGTTAFSTATATAALSVTPAPTIDLQRPAGISIANGGTDTLVDTTPTARETVLTFTIANIGDATLNLTGTPAVSITSTSNATASVTVTPATSLAAAASTTFDINLTPTSIGPFTVEVSIASDDPGNNPFVFAISGTAGDTPEIDVSRAGNIIVNHATHNLGTIPRSTTTMVNFTVTNSGESTLTFDNTPIALSNASNATVTISTGLPATIAAANSVDFTLDITPITTGTFSVRVTITSDDPDESTFVFTVTGSATVGSAPEIAVEHVPGVSLANASTVNLGTLTTGSPRSVTFTIYNQGSADLILQPAQITDETNATATVTGAASSPVTAGTSTTLTLLVTPMAGGAFSFTLSLPSNDADKNPFSLTVAGAASAITAPEIRVYRQGGGEVSDGGTDNVGGVTVGQPLAITYTIENAGNATLIISATALIGFSNASGHIPQQPAATLAPSETTTVIVELTPTEADSMSATLQIESNDADENPFTVTISSAGQVGKFELLRDGLLIGTNDDVSALTADGAVHGLKYTIRNTGSGTLFLLADPSVKSEDGVIVNIQMAGVAQVAAGETADFMVFVDVRQKKQFSAVIEIQTSDPDIGTVTFTITGHGTKGISIGCGALTAVPATGALSIWMLFSLLLVLTFARRHRRSPQVVSA